MSTVPDTQHRFSTVSPEELEQIRRSYTRNSGRKLGDVLGRIWFGR